MYLRSCQNNLLSSNKLYSSPIKWGATTLAITAFALGILAAAYAISGFTSLTHSSHLFAPLGSLNVLQKIVIIVSGTVIALVSIIVLRIFHKKPHPINHTTKPEPAKEITEPESFDAKVSQSLEKVQTAIKSDRLKQHCNNIRNFLSKPYKSKLEYYSFYYCLATVSENVLKDANLKNHWNEFLNEIHGRVMYREDGQHQMHIDCSTEFKRLKGEKIELVVEEIKEHPYLFSPQVRQQIASIEAILKEAFDACEDDYTITHIGSHRCFTISSQGEILGSLFLEEQDDEVNGKELFIHSLARKASAVKLGMTEKFKEHLEKIIQEKNYSLIYCDVLEENVSAAAIYRKIGFRKTGYSTLEYMTGKRKIEMKYDPHGQDVSNR